MFGNFHLRIPVQCFGGQDGIVKGVDSQFPKDFEPQVPNLNSKKELYEWLKDNLQIVTLMWFLSVTEVCTKDVNLKKNPSVI